MTAVTAPSVSRWGARSCSCSCERSAFLAYHGRYECGEGCASTAAIRLWSCERCPVPRASPERSQDSGGLFTSGSAQTTRGAEVGGGV